MHDEGGSSTGFWRKRRGPGARLGVRPGTLLAVLAALFVLTSASLGRAQPPAHGALDAGPGAGGIETAWPASAEPSAASVAEPGADGGVRAPDAALRAGAGPSDDAAVSRDGGLADGGATVVEARTGDGTDGSAVEPADRTGVVIRTLLALLGCLALAYLAGHPRVQKLEELLGISQVVAAGFPFFALGAIAHLPEVGVLSDEVLLDLSPLLELGLGLVGLLAGLSFDVRVAEKWPPSIANLSATLTFVPFLAVAGATGGLLYALDIPVSTSRLLRDAAMFGAAGCLAAPTASALLASTGLSERAVHVVRTVAMVDDVAGVLMLGLLSAFYRPTVAHITWALPGVGWFFVTLGMGLSLGVLIYVIVRAVKSPPELTAVLLGSIALAAGSATFFSVSPIVICFMAGVVLAARPLPHHEVMRAQLARLERPIYLTFLLVAGALWRFDAWQGWLLLPAFVLARLLGRAVAARIARARGFFSDTPGEEAAVSRAFVTAPIGTLSIAMVVNVQTLYPGRAVPLMITVVVGAALVSEIVVQLSSRLGASRRSVPHADAARPVEPGS